MEKEEKKKQRGKKKKPSSGKSDTQVEMKAKEDTAGQRKESVKTIMQNKENDKKERETDQAKEKKKENIKNDKKDTVLTEEEKLVTDEKKPLKKADKQKEKDFKKTTDKRERGKGPESTTVSRAASGASIKASGSRSSEDESNAFEKVTDIKLETVKSKFKIDSAIEEGLDPSNTNFNEMDNEQLWSKTGKKKNKSQKKVSKEAGVVTPSVSVEETYVKLPSSSPQKGESDFSLKEDAAAIKNTSENVSISMDEKNTSDSQHSKTDKVDLNDFQQQPKSLFEKVNNAKKEYESFKGNDKYKNTETLSETSKTSVSVSESNLQNPWKSKVPERVIPDKSRSSISNVTLKSESKKEEDEDSENLSTIDVDNCPSYNIQQEKSNLQSAHKDNFEINNERGLNKEDIKDIPDASASAVSFMDKTESNKNAPEMEESMYESMMEMSIAELPTNTPSDDKLAHKEEKEGLPMAGGKSKKKKRKNKKNGI